MKKLLILTLMIAGLASFKAHDFRQITGRVSEYYSHAPLGGIFVKVKGDTDSVQTNNKGEYSINVSMGAKTLIFSGYSYETKKVYIGKSDTLNVYLNRDAATTSEYPPGKIIHK